MFQLYIKFNKNYKKWRAPIYISLWG